MAATTTKLTPWTAINNHTIHDSRGEFVGQAITTELRNLILHRVNCHEQLVAALEEAIGVIQIFHGPAAWPEYYDHSPEMKRFLAALAATPNK
jgi:hypothetical protein